MSSALEIRGVDVIGIPGQSLTPHELGALVGLADGVPTETLAEQLGADPAALRQVERSIQAKLGARNRLHMITRGFNLGVLVPNALCLLLCLFSLASTDQALRTRSPQRGRTGEYARIVRGTASASGRGRA